MTKDRVYFKIYNLLSNKGLFSHKAPFFNKFSRKGIFILMVALFVGILNLTFLRVVSAMDLKLKSKDVVKGEEKLESVLYQLTRVGDYKEFASKRGLFLSDDKVRVIIELKEEGAIFEDYKDVIIERREKNLIRAMVPVKDLVPLANEPYVRFIRTSDNPVLHIPTLPQKKEEKEDLFKNSTSENLGDKR